MDDIRKNGNELILTKMWNNHLGKLLDSSYNST